MTERIFSLEDLRWMSECAMKTLLATGQARTRDFSISDGEVTTSAPLWLMHPRDRHPHLQQYCQPLPGTALHWSSDYFGECDAVPAIMLLEEVEFWRDFDPTDLDERRTVR